jgi:YYY domain-containing protein
LIGNLGVVHLIRNKLIAMGEVSFPSTIPGFPNTVAFFRGLWRAVFEGARFGVRPESWYWHPTRIIPSEAGNPVAEFPAFTFLYADLHAHMIAFPVTLLAIALAMQWARSLRPNWGSLLLGGLAIGALRATNTWDYPTYLLLGLLALGIGVWRWSRDLVPHKPDLSSRQCDATMEEQTARGEMTRPTDAAARGVFYLSVVRIFVWRAILLIGLTILLYLPYLSHYVAGYSSFELWNGARTPANIYLWIHAILLLPVFTRLAIRAKRVGAYGAAPRLRVSLSFVGGLVIGVALYALGYPVALVTAPIAALVIALFFEPRRSGDNEPGEHERFLWMIVGIAMALSLVVEVVVLKGDIGRMNTVFKFYLQVWILMSIAAAVSLGWVWKRARRWRPQVSDLWWGAMALLILGGALFLPFGIRARAVDRIAPSTGLTLNGMAFMEHAVITDGPDGEMQEISLKGDYHAIRWMHRTIAGSPVILEGLGRREYLWANRVSIYTGLPSVVGWRWHQVQQRAGIGGEVVNRRRADVDDCYSTTDIARAQEILDRYGVRYVYVGGYERAYYDQRGLDKFVQMVEHGLLKVAYDAHGVRLYEVIG